MLEDYFTLGGVQARHRAGLFGGYLDEFVEYLRKQGYPRQYVRMSVAMVRRFGRWMDRCGLRDRDLSEAVIAEFCWKQRHRSWTRNGRMVAVRSLLTHLRELGIVSVQGQVEESPKEQIEHEFASYLREERALSTATVTNYRSVARMFMIERFPAKSIDLAKVCVIDIREFVLRHVHSYCPKRVQLLLTALRAFLRFLFLRGTITVSLAEHIPKVARWRLSGIPASLDAEAIEKTLSCCNRRSAAGQRDYAILLLLARLGLRAWEIVSMELDDVHWDSAEIMVCGKGQERKRFPLSDDVGQAIAEYLKNARPPCNSPRVFLRTRAPYRGLVTSGSLDSIVKRALLRAGLHPPNKGAHLFRHSLATNMLRNGATLTEIGQILHHKSPNTTAIYAKVDLRGLRAIARPWPGETS